MTQSYEYIIVGGGTAGSVVAGRLAEAGHRVLLLEAGSSDRHPAVYIPALAGVVYQKCNWRYMPEPDASRDGVVEAWPSGKLLGGGGSINGMIFVRGNRADYDGWADTGCRGWSYKDVLPHFKRLENWTGGADEFRGSGGPIDVSWCQDEDETNVAFVQAAQQVGFGFNPDYNGREQEGVCKIQMNAKRGIRSQSSRRYLRSLSKPECLTVRTHAFGRRILFEGAKATAVEFAHKGTIHTAFAEKEIVSSAGAIGSPKLLMLSGIGPREVLDAAGVDVLSDLPGVGSNLQEHSSTFLRWNSRVRNINALGIGDALNGVFQYLRNGKGLLATAAYHNQIFCKSVASLPSPDLQIAFTNFALTREKSARDGLLRIGPSKQRGVMITVTTLHPKSVGSVRLRSNNPEDRPLISHEMFGCADDIKVGLEGVRIAREIMSQSVMSGVVTGMFEPEASCKSELDWETLLRKLVTYGAHPVGTCKMGIDPMAVVDPTLQVRGVTGLRVADASIMPTEPSGNTNCPAMMIGEKAASLILGTEATD
jgi:choline dehydrogenase